MCVFVCVNIRVCVCVLRLQYFVYVSISEMFVACVLCMAAGMWEFVFMSAHMLIMLCMTFCVL